MIENTSIYTMEQVTAMLACTDETVVTRIELGEIAAVKFGRGWVFPRVAFDKSLNDLALKLALERQKAQEGRPQPGSFQVVNPPKRANRRRTPPTLAPLPQSTSAPQGLQL